MRAPRARVRFVRRCSCRARCNFGYQVASLAREGDGWVYRERSQLATVMQQQSEVRLSGDLAMRGTTQTGKFQGQDMRLTVTYADGKASGEGMTPSGTQARCTTVKYDGVAVPGRHRRRQS
jgi:hypothetical protein